MSLTTLLEKFGYESVPQYAPCDACVELKRYFDRAPTVPLISDRGNLDTEQLMRNRSAMSMYTTAAAHQGLRFAQTQQPCSVRDREQLDANLLEVLPFTDASFSDSGRMESLEHLRYAHFQYAHPSHFYFGSSWDQGLSLDLRGTVWAPRQVWRRK